MFLSADDAPDRSKWRINWRNISIGLIATFVALWLLWRAIETLAPWYEARSLFRHNPTIGKLPSPLPDQSMAKLAGSRIVLFGLAVQTPWDHAATIQMESNVAMIPFPDQNVVITLFAPDSDTLDKRMYAEASHVRDDASVITSYELLAAEMLSTPDDVKWWNGQKQNEAWSFLLEMKSVRLGTLSEFYSVNLGKLRGFQVGSPSVSPFQVRLDLFDLRDRHYQIRISPMKHDGPVISQPEINAMAASIHALPTP